VSGLGFDAQVVHSFDKFKGRGFLSYAWIALSNYLKFKPKKYNIKLDDKSFKIIAFMVTTANSSQFGNNAYIAPEAKIDDGLFKLVILKPFPFWVAPSIIYRLFTKSLHRSAYISTFDAKSISISTTDDIAQVDGEPIGCGRVNTIEIKESALNIFV